MNSPCPRPHRTAIADSARTPRAKPAPTRWTDTSKMKKGDGATREGLAKYHSFGDMIANDPKFADRKRNPTRLFAHRQALDLEVELETFSPRNGVSGTRRHGQSGGSLFRCAFFQRPLQDSEQLVGKCRSSRIRCEPRGARPRSSCSASCPAWRICASRSDARPNKVYAGSDRIGRERVSAEAKKTITFKSLRETLDLDPNAALPRRKGKGKHT